MVLSLNFCGLCLPHAEWGEKNKIDKIFLPGITKLEVLAFGKEKC
jgi:hypothetical protein